MHLGSLTLAATFMATGLAVVSDAGEPPSTTAEKHVRVLNEGKTVGPTPPGMVLVPGGRSTIGVSEKDMLELGSRERYAAIKHIIGIYPAHEPEIDQRPEDLFVDIHECTNEQWKAFLEGTHREPSEDLLEYRWFYWERGEKKTGLPDDQWQLPVSAVSFYEAQQAVRWMGKRLPTEYEWEHAGRHSLKKNQYYLSVDPGWNAWDRGLCCNVHNSTQGGDIRPVNVGSFPMDKSAQGLMDLMGNVSEWTSTPFGRYPGFEAIYFKAPGRKDKQKETGKFNTEFRVYRGGNFMGNEINCNLVFRDGMHPRSTAEGVGFRGVMSTTPGLDRLRRAQQKDLTLLLNELKKKFDWSPETMVSQQIWRTEGNVYGVSDVFAFARVKALNSKSESAVKKNTVKEPEAAAIFVTSQPIANPKLPPGAYVVSYRAEGATEEQKEYQKNKRRADQEAAREKAKDEDKKKSGRSSRGKKDDKKDEQESEEAEGEEEEKTEEQLAAEAAEEEARKQQEAIDRELERIGAKPARSASSIDPATLPTDTDMLLIKDQAGNLVAYLPITPEKGDIGPVRWGYAPGEGTLEGVSTNATAGRADIDSSQANDLATIVFPMIAGRGKQQMQGVLKLEFAPGAFEPVRMPDMAAEEDKKKRRR